LTKYAKYAMIVSCKMCNIVWVINIALLKKNNGMEGKMNMPIGMNMLGGSMESRIQLKINELALELASEVEIEEVEVNILLEDPEIYAVLQKKAQLAIEEADKRKKQEILTAAKKKLGIEIEKSKKISTPAIPVVIIQPPVESAWQKYLKERECSLPDSLTQLETSEEVSAARGFLIKILTCHRRNPDWMNDELRESVDVWHKRVQTLLDVINEFFDKKDDLPIASSEVYCKVSNLLEGDRDLRWYMGGPMGIQAELNAKRKEQEFAQQKAIERQQRKEASELRKQEIVGLLVTGNVSSEDAEKLAGTTIKKFPDLEIGEALLKMAINRQVAAIQQNREFLDNVAPEAKPYLSGVAKSEKEFLLKVGQHSEVEALLKRDAADSRILKR